MLVLKTALVLISVLFTFSSAKRAKTERVICYFANWSWYRTGEGKHLPDNIDPSICTNIVYAFSTLNPGTLLMQSSDTWADIDNKFYKRVTDLKNRGVKVSLAIGGWNDSQGTKYSSLLNNPASRANFITNTVDFLQKNGFEGLDLDIEYPSCPQGNCGSLQDKDGFSALIKELSAAFKPRGWVLSAAISASERIINAAYDVKDLDKYLDWIGVMTYDYHGAYDGRTGPNSPLHTQDGSPSVENTINYLMKQGASSKKLVLGIPLYGRSFQLSDSSNTNFGSPTVGSGTPGAFTREGGMLAFYEICQNINQGWTVVENKDMGAYGYHQNQWASFISVKDIKYRVKYMKKMKLGGVMVWDLSLDDFNGVFCRKGKYPLLTEINTQLGKK